VEQYADVDATTLGTNARERYLSWLQEGRGIFHVAGKLGSGKSTLMKFLFNHPETRRQLLTWAGLSLLSDM
jgi:type II secretory ATPase GspE/PulE/Tfp pilus assembly ATPase PilB-like protein